MTWNVSFAEEYEPEFDALAEKVQDAILARAVLLQREGPALGRPFVDTLVGSRHRNMKELRCMAAGGVWRVAFAFDPARTAILLAGGSKSGIGTRRFYKRLVAIADLRYERHLQKLSGT